MEMIPHPLHILRERIRHAGRQFRHNNDTSPSLFHPASGFVSAYDIAEVEAALDEYEASLPSKYREKENTGMDDPGYFTEGLL